MKRRIRIPNKGRNGMDLVRGTITFIETCAPDDFQDEDLGKDESTRLITIFNSLHENLDFICSKRSLHLKRDELVAALNNSLKAYQAGDSDLGLKFLYEFEDIIFVPKK